MTTRLSNEAPREWRPVAEPSADHSPFGSCASSWQSLERKRPSVSREAAAQVVERGTPGVEARSRAIGRPQPLRELCEQLAEPRAEAPIGVARSSRPGCLETEAICSAVSGLSTFGRCVSRRRGREKVFSGVEASAEPTSYTAAPSGAGASDQVGCEPRSPAEPKHMTAQVVRQPVNSVM